MTNIGRNIGRNIGKETGWITRKRIIIKRYRLDRCSKKIGRK